MPMALSLVVVEDMHMLRMPYQELDYRGHIEDGEGQVVGADQDVFLGVEVEVVLVNGDTAVGWAVHNQQGVGDSSLLWWWL